MLPKENGAGVEPAAGVVVEEALVKEKEGTEVDGACAALEVEPNVNLRDELKSLCETDNGSRRHPGRNEQGRRAVGRAGREEGQSYSSRHGKQGE